MITFVEIDRAQQDVAQLSSVELPPVLGQPQGLRHHLWLRPGVPPGGQIYLPYQVSLSSNQTKQSINLAGIFSVIGNLSLALVTATMSFRIYKSVLTAVNKTQDGHPFKVTIKNQSKLNSAFSNIWIKNNSTNWLLSKIQKAWNLFKLYTVCTKKVSRKIQPTLLSLLIYSEANNVLIPELVI